MELINKLKKEFSFLNKENILGILLYGSKANGLDNERSDTDICIVAPDIKSKDILKIITQSLDIYGKKYDVYTFEELPMYLKIEIINNHKLIFSSDKFKLYEYFYFFRKLWQDQEHRQKITKKQLLNTLV